MGELCCVCLPQVGKAEQAKKGTTVDGGGGALFKTANYVTLDHKQTDSQPASLSKANLSALPFKMSHLVTIVSGVPALVRSKLGNMKVLAVLRILSE